MLDSVRAMPHHRRLGVGVRRGLLILLLWALPVYAAEVPAALRNWLQALDSAPTPAQLQRAGGPQTAALLERVARDAHELPLVRNRALGLLSLLDDAPSEARLRDLLRLPEDRLRATAALAWLAGPARRHGAGTEATVAALLADRAAGVRSAAARGLGYLADPRQARALAVQQRAREADPTVRAALDAAMRQLDRAAPQR